MATSSNPNKPSFTRKAGGPASFYLKEGTKELHSHQKQKIHPNRNYTFSKEKRHIACPNLNAREDKNRVKKIVTSDSQSDKKAHQKSSNFIQSINGYINLMKNPESTAKCGQRDQRQSQKKVEQLLKQSFGIKKQFPKSTQQGKMNWNKSIIKIQERESCERNKSEGKRQIKSLSRKVTKQKIVNKNLQKCIIQIQKVLWERAEHLQILQEQIQRKISNENNISRVRHTETRQMTEESEEGTNNQVDSFKNREEGNVSSSSKELGAWWQCEQKKPFQRDKGHKNPLGLKQMNTFFREEGEQEEEDESDWGYNRNGKMKDRRKTEIPQELKSMLTRTVGMKEKPSLIKEIKEKDRKRFY